MQVKKQSLEQNAPFAEIIESNLHNFTAQCWKWDFFPKFSSLVQSENQDKIILGIVTQIQTGSMDQMRYPFPYKKTEEELIAEQPQIFEFLKTTFTVQITGYIEKDKPNKINYLLAPKPCKIHSFVKNSDKNLAGKFFSNTDFLNILFGHSGNISNLDELLLSILKKIKDQGNFSVDLSNKFCKTFALLTGNDYKRLKLFLKRIETV